MFESRVAFVKIMKNSKTKDGKAISYEINKKSKLTNSWWQDYNIKAYIDGLEVGYICVTHIPDAVWKEKCSFIQWLVKIKCLEIKEGKITIRSAQDVLRGGGDRVWVRSNDNDEAILKKLKKVFFSEYMDFKKYHNDDPYVAYIEVDNKLAYRYWDSEEEKVRAEEELISEGKSPFNNRRRGIAKQLYKAGSVLMASFGKTLCSDTLQSEDALKFWANCGDKMPNCKKFNFKSRGGKIFIKYRVDYQKEFKAVLKEKQLRKNLGKKGFVNGVAQL